MDSYGPLPDASESSAPVPFEPFSSYGRVAAKTVTAVVAVSAVAVGVVAVPGRSVLDPPACAAAAYVTFVFCFQKHLLEWPSSDLGIALLLAGALGALVLPTAAAAAGLWGSAAFRAASLALDLGLAAAAYNHMVRGPGCSPAVGSLADRVCVVTGCNTGIGYETAEALARAGGLVVFACRSEERARAAMGRLLRATRDAGVTEERLRFMPLDVSSLQSVRRFGEEFQRSGLALHLLVLNAGVMLRERNLSEDGFEMTMASNHFGHFLLTQLLLPQLLAAEARAERPRVVVVGSNLCYQHDVFDFAEVVAVPQASRKVSLSKPYSMFRAYSQSKLANLLFTAELARRLQQRGSTIPANAVHPGEVLTEVMRDMHPVLLFLYVVFKPFCYLFFKSARQGSLCTVHVATAPSLATSHAASGEYFIRLAPTRASHPACHDRHAARRLWDASAKLTDAPTW